MRDEWVVFDFESQSANNIKVSGAQRYCEDETTRPTALGIAWPNGDLELWKPFEDDTPPERLCEHIAAGRRAIAANVAFDFSLWKSIRARDPRWPELKLEQTECLLARAKCLGLPGHVEGVCGALRLPENKDQEGSKALKKIMRPRTKEPLTFWTPETAPNEYPLMYRYCLQDAKIERDMHLALAPMTDEEREIWLLDQEINLRGVLLDVPNIRRAHALLEQQKDELRSKAKTLVGFHTGQAKALKEWLTTEGIELPNVQKGTIATALTEAEAAGNIAVSEVLRIRQQASKSSTAKFEKMLANACADHRGRGLYFYHGAGPGRWAGRLWQPQNLPRQTKTFKAKHADDVIDWLKYPNAGKAIAFEYGSVTEPLSLSLRGFVIASPGNRLVVADFSNIEGRMLAWLAGEEWKLKAFRLYDTFVLDENGNRIPDGKGDWLRMGPDLYRLAFANSFGVTVGDVDDDQRQVGKCQELGLGFVGAIAALLKMCSTYSVDPAAIAVAVKAITPADVFAAALAKCPKPGTRARCNIADPEVWAGLRIVVDRWREAHPATRAFWKDVDSAAKGAVERPGDVTEAGRVKYRLSGDFLQCRLPSGRKISYPYPEFKRFPTMDWEEKRDELKHAIKEAAAMGESEAAESYARELAEHQANVKWESRLTAWGESSEPGGPKKWRCRELRLTILVENIVQGAAADCQRTALLNAKRYGYPVVMHSHDEIVADTPNGFGSVSDFASKMCAQKQWAEGLPIAAAGYESLRYKK
jgi:DNA polymerase